MKSFAKHLVVLGGFAVFAGGCSTGSTPSSAREPASSQYGRMSGVLDEFVESLGCDEIYDHVWKWGNDLAINFDADGNNSNDAFLRRVLGEKLVARGRLALSSPLLQRLSQGRLGRSEGSEGQVYDGVTDLYRFFSQRVPEALEFEKIDQAGRQAALLKLRDGDLDSDNVTRSLQGELSTLVSRIKLDADAADIQCHKPVTVKAKFFPADFVNKTRAAIKARFDAAKKNGGQPKPSFQDNVAGIFRRREMRVDSPTASKGDDAKAPAPLLDVDAGARRVFTTLYQSCKVLSLPPMPAGFAIKGIEENGRHENGTGKRRFIGDLDALVQSHYYVSGFEPSASCVDIRKHPPIYDYGGKPFVTKDPVSLDLFQDGGSGTEALGIDCSGFVTSSLMAAGLRLTEDKALSPFADLDGTNADALRQPQSNGLTCLSTFQIKRVSKDEITTLQSGDIAASKGHVIIVEKVGADPFGLANIDKASECTADHFNPNDFDIQIIHSSPQAAGIGLARQKLSAFTSEGFRAAFVELAVLTCKAKFDSEKIGKSVTGAGVNFVRHDLSDECRQAPIPLVSSKCVESCWK